MLGLLIASTAILGLSAFASQALRSRGHEWQRLVLLAGMTTTLLLPLAGWLALHLPVSQWVHVTVSDPLTPGSNSEEAIWPSAFFLIWLCGVMLMSVRLGWQVWLARGLAKRSCVPGKRELGVISDELALSNATCVHRFRISDEIDTPMVMAGMKQLVLLPVGWSEWIPSLRNSALRHEWRHVRAGDAQWGVVAALLRVVLWFHPLAWWVSARWAEHCEHLADRAASEGGCPAEYARDLLNIVRECRAGSLELATAFAPQSRSRLERRVRALLENSGSGLPCGRLAIAGVLSAFAFAALLITALFTPSQKSPKPLIETEAQTRLEANPFPADP